MKKFIVPLLSILSMVSPGLIQGAETDRVYTLKIADPFPVKHPLNKVVNHFMKEVIKGSNGQIQFKYYPAQQLGKMKDLLKICQQGMTDIAYIGTGFFPGKFGLNLVMNLPFYTSAIEGTKIYMALLKNSPELQAEWTKNKVRPMILGVGNQYDVGTTKRPVARVEDLKGLRLRVAGGQFETARRYGITPVTMPANDVYEALQRGILDGTVLTLPSIKGYRLYELEKYHTLGLRMGGFCGTYVINEKAWRKLPPELQQTLMEAGHGTGLFFARLWDGMVIQLVQAFEKGGMKITRVSSENRALWDAPLAGIEEEWIAKNEKRGLPARRVFEQFKKLAGEIAK